jgi:hypothetical protein
MALGVSISVNAAAASPAINESPLNIVGVLVKSNRGPNNVVLPLTSIADYEVKFGKPSSSSEFFHTYYNLKGLFEEASPSPVVVYALRVPGSSAGTTASISNGTGATQIKIESAYQGQLSYGTYGNNVKVVLVENGTTGKWILNIYEADPVTGNTVLRETYDGLTHTNIVSEVNVKRPSNYVTVSVGTSVTTLAAINGFLSGGTNPTDPTPSQLNSALSLFDNYNINYIIAPDFMDDTVNSPTICDDLGSYATSRADVTAIVAAPSSYQWDTVTTFGLGRQKSQVFLTGYFNWFKIRDLFDVERTICPVGHIIGAYWIRKSYMEGNIAHSAPGGVTTPIRTIRGLQYPTLTLTQADTVKSQAGLNATIFQTGFGYVILSSRSFSTDSRFYNSHRNRSINFLVGSQKTALLFYNQFPNNETTRSKVTGILEAFFSRQYDLGMFDTDGPRDQSYKIVCTASNNPASVKIQRWLVVDEYVKFVEVNELVRINIVPTEIGQRIIIQ